MSRKYIVESYPLVVREKIDYFISEGFNPLSIFKWLEENMYPVWRKERKQEWCVSRKTIYNYMKKRCPENLLVSATYLEGARKRFGEDVDVMGKLRENITTLEALIKKFDLSEKMSIKQIGSMRLLLHEVSEAYRKYMDLEIRLGLRKEEKKEETTENILERLKKAQEKKEDEILQKATGT